MRGSHFCSSSHLHLKEQAVSTSLPPAGPAILLSYKGVQEKFEMKPGTPWESNLIFQIQEKQDQNQLHQCLYVVYIYQCLPSLLLHWCSQFVVCSWPVIEPSWQNWSFYKTISHPSLQIKAVYCRDSIFPWPWAGWIYGFEAREGQTICRPYRRSPSIDCAMELRSQATFR